MKTLKDIIVIVIIVVFPALLALYIKPEDLIMKIIVFLVVFVFVFNIIFRKSLLFKNYFTSKYNILTTKVRMEKLYDIPINLMYDNIIEVIDKSNFKLVKSDTPNYQLLAISKVTFWSWGENIYINFEKKGSDTVMLFCSSTLFGIYSWGKIEKNYSVLLSEIESSLIV